MNRDKEDFVSEENIIKGNRNYICIKSQQGKFYTHEDLENKGKFPYQQRVYIITEPYMQS